MLWPVVTLYFRALGLESALHSRHAGPQGANGHNSRASLSPYSALQVWCRMTFYLSMATNLRDLRAHMHAYRCTLMLQELEYIQTSRIDSSMFEMKLHHTIIE
ncbi:hypothetical protein NPIL_387101 [Nephila pilipes]|uniref:Uncharacterized protein n=1 Tax=Nephila pilipes TaxID=299642 RepID=A0A8X6UBG7_NEPPI|nr:hypothetical protein NPIL_387101 [Nephila pilipes]